MKKYLFIVLVLFAVFCNAQTAEAEREKKLALSFAGYPSVMAEFGKHKLLKKDIIKLVIAKHPDFEKYSFDELKDVTEQIVDEQIYFTLLSDFLAAEGFSPSYKMTLQYLEDSIRKFPLEIRKLKFKNSAVQALAAEPDRQLTVALQNYLKKKKPSEITVPDEDVEFFYRVNQNIFTKDAKLDISFIAVEKKQPDALKKINDAYSMLMQGVRFGKIAEEINKALPKELFDIDRFPAEFAVRAAEMPID